MARKRLVILGLIIFIFSSFLFADTIRCIDSMGTYSRDTRYLEFKDSFIPSSDSYIDNYDRGSESYFMTKKDVEAYVIFTDYNSSLIVLENNGFYRLDITSEANEYADLFDAGLVKENFGEWLQGVIDGKSIELSRSNFHDAELKNVDMYFYIKIEDDGYFLMDVSTGRCIFRKSLKEAMSALKKKQLWCVLLKNPWICGLVFRRYY